MEPKGFLLFGLVRAVGAVEGDRVGTMLVIVVGFHVVEALRVVRALEAPVNPQPERVVHLPVPVGDDVPQLPCNTESTVNFSISTWLAEFGDGNF